jgi:hypothetical protein
MSSLRDRGKASGSRHMFARRKVVGAVDAKAHQTAKQANRRQAESALDHAFGLGIKRRGRQRDGKREQEESEPRRIFRRVNNGSHIRLSVPQ